jgi:hypothetical protein
MKDYFLLTLNVYIQPLRDNAAATRPTKIPAAVALMPIPITPSALIHKLLVNVTMP